MKSTTRVAAVLGLALVAPLAAACSGDGQPPAATPSISVTTTTAPGPVAAAAPTGQHTGTPPAAPPTATPAPAGTDLADGDHVAHLTRVDPAAGAVTVDVIQFLTGDAAARAAAEDGAEVPPPNDYYVRNASSRLRTLLVTPRAAITVNVHAAQESGNPTKNVRKTLAQLAGVHGLQDGTFRLTVAHGEVTRIAEIYLP